MNTPEIIEFNNQRLLTTEQLAEFYGTTTETVRKNFSNNKDKFIEGKHFYLLEGTELQSFKNSVNNIHSVVGKNARSLILYTKQGASRHSKMLGTDKAWDMFDELEENYFNPKKEIDTSNLSPELQMFNGLFKALASQELATKQLENKVDNISEIVSLNVTDWRKESQKLIRRMAQNQGGFGAYQEINTAIYEEIENRAAANLKQRLTNKRGRMALEGVSKSKLDKLNKLDVIGEDKRLLQIYLAVVKEFAIKYGIDLDDIA